MTDEGLELGSSESKPMLPQLYHPGSISFSEFFVSGTARKRNLGPYHVQVPGRLYPGVSGWCDVANVTTLTCSYRERELPLTCLEAAFLCKVLLFPWLSVLQWYSPSSSLTDPFCLEWWCVQHQISPPQFPQAMSGSAMRPRDRPGWQLSVLYLLLALPS